MHIYFLFVYKLFLFLILSFAQILNRFYILSDSYNNYISLFLMSQIGPAFIKISQVSQNEFIGSKDTENQKKYFNILDNIYIQKKISLNLNNSDIKIVKDLSVASGSMAYVYEILYKNKKAILKRYCADENNIYSGIKLYKFLLSSGFIASKSNLFKIIDYKTYHQYFLDQINSELEVKNLNIFREIFKKFDNIHIPECYYYDKQHIIMSYEKGINLFDFLEKHKHNSNIIEETYLLLFSSIYKMVIKKIFHGDYHAGNLLFYIENEKVNITILDYGMILKINDKQVDFFINIFKDIDKYSKNSSKKHIADFFWHFGNHTQKYSQETFLKIIMNHNKKDNIILPPKKFVYIPEHSMEIMSNQKLIDIGFSISQEYYNMMITLEIIMKKITNYAKLDKKFKKKLQIYSIDNEFMD